MRLTVLGSGSSGNCAVVSTENTTILIDAGISARQIGVRLEACGYSTEDLDAILLTHEHKDHTGGLEVFCRKSRAPIVCTGLTQESVTSSLRFRSPPSWKLMTTGQPFEFRDLRIEAFPVPHDAVDPVGFVIESDAARLGVLSDVGYVTSLIKDRLRHSDTLFVEANYDSQLLDNDTHRPWSTKQRISSRHGHLSNDQTAELLSELAHADLTNVVLGHLSDDCNCPNIAAEKMRQALAAAGASHTKVVCAARKEPTATLEVAAPRRPQPPEPPVVLAEGGQMAFWEV
jgi:phosphoribosyl 1,2-cyclic phosphodiesterase